MAAASLRQRGIRRAPKIRDCARLRCRRVVWEAANALALYYAALANRAGSTNPYLTKDLAGECLESFVVGRLPAIFGMSLGEFQKARRGGKTLQTIVREAQAGVRG